MKSDSKLKLNQIIIWGHPLYSHTHSFIHYGFEKSFRYLGYKTFWFSSSPPGFNFDYSLFITEGQVDSGENPIPKNSTSVYLLHNSDHIKYKDVPGDQIFNLQVSTLDCIGRDIPIPGKRFEFYSGQTLYFPWATDLLPHEIEYKPIDNPLPYEINFIGYLVEPWIEFKKVCEKRGIKFVTYGGTFDFNSKNNKTCEENRELIHKSIIAPALQSDWQVEKGYIPCRIFKNISYGKMGVTNNKTVNKLFDNKLIYDTDLEKLLETSLEFEKSPDKSRIKELMEDVKKNHTYVNRVESIVWFLKNFDIILEKRI